MDYGALIAKIICFILLLQESVFWFVLKFAVFTVAMMQIDKGAAWVKTEVNKQIEWKD